MSGVRPDSSKDRIAEPAWLGKVDFHLHSRASNVTDYYTANVFGIPESYSDPIELHRVLKERGMSLVTLTDHNSIDGVLAMLDKGLPDVFISAEMTTTFPEDGCNIHVTVANLTEAQFREIDRLRGNVYEMVAYVEEQIARERTDPGANRLAYFMTHPLMSTQNRPYGREGALSADHIEKALLLFPCLEIQNGTRSRSLNEFTGALLRSLDREAIERLADKHGIVPNGDAPWRKAVVGGSDDHSGINPGRTWTEFPLRAGESTATVDDVISAIRARESAPAGEHGGPITLAHAILKLLYERPREEARVGAGDAFRLDESLTSLLKFAFGSDEMTIGDKAALRLRGWLDEAKERFTAAGPAAPRFEQMLGRSARKLVLDPAFRARVAAAATTDEKIFLVFSTLINRMLLGYVSRLSGGSTRNLVASIKELVALVSSNVLVSLPYLMSYSIQSSDRLIVRDVRRRFRIAEPEKLLLVTDTFFEVNGVSKTIRRMMVEASRRGIDLTVLTCLTAEEQREHLVDSEVRTWVDAGRLKIIEPVVSFELAAYAGLHLRLPPFLDLLKFAQEGGFTKMQISTPGAVGVAGLLAAKVLQMQTSSTYHTCFPEYVENYTRDVSLEALAWKAMILFYHSVDEAVVPSRFVAKLLHQRGLRNRKLLVLDRWVDVERYRPDHRDETFWSRFGLAGADRLVKFVYVGRLGVEKNLDVLADAYRKIRETTDRAHLILVGDGPYRGELERRLRGLPVTFTGFLGGDDLAVAIASADAKVFPSTTDTWGNAPLEAQASGLPVVVTDRGGPQELVLDGVTGFRVPGHSVDGLLEAMNTLMNDEVRGAMGADARRYVVANDVEQPFSAILDADAYRRRQRAAKKARSGRKSAEPAVGGATSGVT